MSGFWAKNVRYPRYQDTDLLQLWRSYGYTCWSAHRFCRQGQVPKQCTQIEAAEILWRWWFFLWVIVCIWPISCLFHVSSGSISCNWRQVFAFCCQFGTQARWIGFPNRELTPDKAYPQCHNCHLLELQKFCLGCTGGQDKFYNCAFSAKHWGRHFWRPWSCGFPHYPTFEQSLWCLLLIQLFPLYLSKLNDQASE